jgi:peptide/nickel transport system substrate-binding protein
MRWRLRVLAAAGALLTTASIALPAFAQKQGGTLKLNHFDSPASMSIHEEAAAVADVPMMAVFNNLVLFGAAHPGHPA